MLTIWRLVCGLGIVALALVRLLSVADATETSERRVALVIGNSNYRTVPPLPNPRNDAEDVAAALQADGFEVISRQDLDRRGMGEALGRFAREAETADVALFYYAGHGLQFRGENFLVPVDGSPADEFAIPYETTRVADAIDALSHAKGVRVLILDACRNNPLADRIARSLRTRDIGVTRGLARITQSQGMVIAYATQANDVATDGQGRNSPFSAAFIEQLKEPGLEIGQVFRRVAALVNRRTNGQQTPELSLSLLGDFYFNRSETDLQAWTKLRESTDPDSLRAFLARYPNSVLADAGKARLDLIDRSRREEVLQKQLASYEEEKRKAADAAEAARRADAVRQAREKAEREQLASAQADAKRQAQEDAARQQAEQERRLNERLAALEAENRKAQAELAARGEEQARRAKDEKERDRQAAERDRLAAAQTERMKAAEAEAQRQKSVEDRRIAERLAKLEEDNRRAAAELAARTKAEETMRASAERERAQLTAALEAERRKASEELQRVQREKDEAARQQTATEPAVAQPPVKVASLPTAPTAPSELAPTQSAQASPPLVSSIKRELERLGCYHGRVDEDWATPQTKRSVNEFARLAHLEAPHVPDAALLETLKAQRVRVCPLMCGPRQVERGGACIAKTCPRGERLDEEGDCVAPPPKRVVPPLIRHAAPTPVRPEPTRPAAPPKRVAQRAAPEPAQNPRVRAIVPPPIARAGTGHGGRCFMFKGQSYCE